MLTLFLSYAATIGIYAVLGLGLALLFGALGVGLLVTTILSCGLCATLGCSLDFYSRWRLFKRNKAKNAAYLAMLKEMGIDVEKLKAEAIDDAKKRAEARAEAAN